jgi:flavorubredoxin
MMAEKVFAINHDRKEIMAVGHESWGGTAGENIKERLAVYAPRHAAGRDQFVYMMEQFDVQELEVQSKVTELGYKQVPGYWDAR